MPTAARKSSYALILFLSIFALGLLWSVAFMVSFPPRGYLFWITIDFLSFFIVAAALLALNMNARASAAIRPSGATLVMVSGLLFLDFVLTIASILIYKVANGDHFVGEIYLAAWLASVNGVLFILGALLYGRDLSERKAEAPILAARVENRREGARLSIALDKLASLTRDRPNARVPLDSLLRELRVLQSDISNHSPTLGSWEQGAPASVNAGFDAPVAALTLAVDELAAADESQFPAKLAAAQQRARDLRDRVDVLDTV